MSIATLEKGGWNRVYFYSSLFDFYGTGDRKKRTASQKFVLQGKTAVIRLLKLHYFTQEEAEWVSSTIISQISPGTMNGAALALACTTYDLRSKTFLWEPDPSSTGEYRHYQSRKCWKTLVKTLSSSSSPLSSFQQEYGITPSDLLRYFLLLREGKWSRSDDDDTDQDYE